MKDRPACGACARIIGRLAGQYGLKKSRCTTALDPGEYNLLLTEAPEVPDEELRAAIRWRIKDLIDFPIQNATIELFELPGERVPGRPRSVYAVAARNEAVQRRVELMTSSGIHLDIVDIPELAQRNLAALLPQDERGVVRLDLNRPMREILAELSKHPVKTRLSLTGTLVVARDIAHAKIKERLDRGEELPQYLKDHPVYYAGPAKKPGTLQSGREK